MTWVSRFCCCCIHTNQRSVDIYEEHALIADESERSDDSMDVDLLTTAATEAFDHAQLLLQTESSSDDMVCRICYEDVLPPTVVPNPRDAFFFMDDVVVELCQCRSSPYHIGCLYQQLDAFANNCKWSRMCGICERPWTFVPRSRFKVSPYYWTWWDGTGFLVRKLDPDKDVFTEELMDGIRILVGPDTASTPPGPLIPLAEAYTTVEVHLQENPGQDMMHHFNGATVGKHVPWSTLYSFLFPGR